MRVVVDLLLGVNDCGLDLELELELDLGMAGLFAPLMKYSLVDLPMVSQS